MKTRVNKRSHDRPSLEPATRSSTLQSKAASGPRQQQQQQHIAQLQQNVPNTNRTGLPDTLKSGIEALSGMDMSGVRVHRNSDKPAALQAHAYAQGSDIHLGPGQEKHLPHEAWHVVQQAQGRVRPTMQMRPGISVNDDMGLEREADAMGEKALAGSIQMKTIMPAPLASLPNDQSNASIRGTQLPAEEDSIFGERKSEFLQQMRTALTNVGNEIFEQSPLNAHTCPWISRWFEIHYKKSANETQAAILDYLGIDQTTEDYRTIISLVCKKARGGFESHLRTGTPSNLPNEVSMEKGGPMEMAWNRLKKRPPKKTLQAKKKVGPIIQMGGCTDGKKAPSMDLSFDATTKAHEIWARSKEIENSAETGLEKFKREHPDKLTEDGQRLTDIKYRSLLDSYTKSAEPVKIYANDDWMSPGALAIKKIIDNTYPSYQAPLRAIAKGETADSPDAKRHLAENADIVEAFSKYTPVQKTETRFATVFPGGITDPKDLVIDQEYIEPGYVYIGGERPSDSGYKMSIHFTKCYAVDARSYYGHSTSSDEKMQWITLPGAKFKYEGNEGSVYKFTQISR